MVQVQQHDNSSASDQVEWTTIIYTLIPLATATMTQPVGSVLGSNPISKTYLRSSPIFCAIDGLVFLLELLRHRLFYHLSFRAAARTVVERRYRDVRDETEGLRTLRSGAVMRWVVFVLGTHGCVLKLVGAEGIAWTQAWGYSYVGSFVVFEAMILLMPEKESDTEAQIRPEYRGGAFGFPFVDWPVLAGFTTAFIGTLCLLFYAAYTLFIKFGTSPLLMIPGLFAGIIMGNTFIVLAFRWLMVQHPSIGERILILNKADAELIRRNKVLYNSRRRSWKFDDGIGLMLWPLFFFNAHLVLCLLWYRFAYDPSNTRSASWADVFG